MYVKWIKETTTKNKKKHQVVENIMKNQDKLANIKTN